MDTWNDRFGHDSARSHPDLPARSWQEHGSTPMRNLYVYPQRNYSMEQRKISRPETPFEAQRNICDPNKT